MDLLERYLHATRSHLPARIRDEVLVELRSDIEAEAAEQEAALGRALTLDEEETILRRWGHPAELAARYRSRQHLIGPTLFPLYMTTLGLSLGTALPVGLLVGIAVVAAGAGAERHAGALLMQQLLRLCNIAIHTFAWITLAFALLETPAAASVPRRSWRPRDLPLPTLPRVPRERSLVSLAVTLVVLWWLVVLRLDPAFVGLDQVPFALSRPARAAYVAALLLLAVRAVQQLLTFTQPARVRLGLVVGSTTSGLLALMALALAILGPVVVLDPEAADPSRLAATLQNVDAGARIVLACVAIVIAGGAARKWAPMKNRTP
jgi:hypothetical protein